MLQHTGTITLQTERLTLRPFTMDDAADMYANWVTDPEVTRYLRWPPHDSIDVTNAILDEWIAEYTKPDYYHWCIELRAEHMAIGSIGLISVGNETRSGEVGYALSRKYWNQGLATEALTAMIQYLINEVHFERIEAKHIAENKASGRVMEKAGMQYEGTLRKHLLGKDGRLYDGCVYAVVSAKR